MSSAAMFGLPAAATKVGSQSRPETMPFSTLPAGTLPGQRMMQGTRKPPSSAVPLPPAKGVCPPSGQVKFSAPLSVVKTTMVVHICRPAMHHVARANCVFKGWRVIGVEGVFHGVQVIQVAKVLIEAVNGGQELVEVTQVVLAKLTGFIAHGLERGGDGHGLRRYPNRGAGLAD